VAETNRNRNRNKRLRRQPPTQSETQEKGEEVHSLALAVSIQRKMVLLKREVGIWAGCGDGTYRTGWSGRGMGRR
jgi:hypothetical protein